MTLKAPVGGTKELLIFMTLNYYQNIFTKENNDIINVVTKIKFPLLTKEEMQI